MGPYVGLLNTHTHRALYFNVTQQYFSCVYALVSLWHLCVISVTAWSAAVDPDTGGSGRDRPFYVLLVLGP